jgi:hypothetical protein
MSTDKKVDTAKAGNKKSKKEDQQSAASILTKTPPLAATTPAPSTLMGSPDPDEVILTDAEGRRYCRVSDCDQIANVDTYCRYHYLLHWKKIQVRKKILADGKLDRYIEELTARYTDKFLELLRKDLRTEKDFSAAIQELELGDAEDRGDDDDDDSEDSKSYVDEIGGNTESSGRDDDF